MKKSRMTRLRQSLAKRRKNAQANQFKLKEGATFIEFLLVELQLTDQDLRDPAKRQEMIRLMRANDQQAQTIVQRAEAKQLRDQRKTLQQEPDPRKAALRRKRMGLMRQVGKIDSDLNATTLQQQRQAQTDSNAKL